MAGLQLPLQVKVALRDQWEKVDAPAQVALKNLSGVLGLPVRVNLQAELLWQEIGKFYEDKTIFVPSVVEIVTAWARTLQTRLEDESLEDWTEQLLETFDTGMVTAYVETSSRSSEPATTLATDEPSPFFRIVVPASKPPFYNASSSLASCYASLFEKPAPGAVAPSGGPTPVAAASNSSASGQSQVRLPGRPKPSSLPTLESLSRPEMLMTRDAPYHLLVESTRERILIMGSHEPTVSLIYSYFKKWVRNDRNSVPDTPCVTIELKESNFGYGTLRDTIVIERRSNHLQLWRELNPVLILAFVESALGYDMLEQAAANSYRWHFRRLESFR